MNAQCTAFTPILQVNTDGYILFTPWLKGYFNKMKRIFLLFLTVFFPWVVLLINDDPVSALIAMFMQVTLIGWIPASIWASRSIKAAAKKKQEPVETETHDIK